MVQVVLAVPCQMAEEAGDLLLEVEEVQEEAADQPSLAEEEVEGVQLLQEGVVEEEAVADLTQEEVGEAEHRRQV